METKKLKINLFYFNMNYYKHMEVIETQNKNFEEESYVTRKMTSI